MADIKVCDNCRSIIQKNKKKNGIHPFFVISINIPAKGDAPINLDVLLEKLKLKEGKNDICIDCLQNIASQIKE
jgi:hypothetical protein